MPYCVALIVAAGRGSRFGGPLPKQYALLDGEPVLRRTIEVLRSASGIDEVRVVIAPGDEEQYGLATRGAGLGPPVLGGASRQQSVRNGLEALAADAPDMVAIHDAARPFVRVPDIIACLEAAAMPGIDGAVLGVPLADTLKQVDDGFAIAQTVPRQSLWRAQTPQVFRFGKLLAAHREAASLATEEATALTDDSAVAERAGLRIVMVEGHDDNRKITTAHDMTTPAPSAVVETRTALGFDVHGFGPGKAVMLGGVAIAHDRALAGHSDADVALHALTDAVLGTIAAGDIGKHFPPSDPQWRGVSSDRFLRHAVGLLAASGGRILHLDLTVICEAPRVGPHRDAMIESIARIAGIGRDRVSVKATTTEGLGFTGRREGIAAQAVATVELPPEIEAAMFDHQMRDAAERVLHACRRHRLKLVTAESCTGGLVAATLTAIAGSSDVVERAYVTYANEAKREMLGVPWDALLGHGAVSEPVARAMASGALVRSGMDLSVSVTGVAGPGGGTPDKPVGLVHFAGARRGYDTVAERHVFPGDRDAIRRVSVITALTILASLAER